MELILVDLPMPQQIDAVVTGIRIAIPLAVLFVVYGFSRRPLKVGKHFDD